MALFMAPLQVHRHQPGINLRGLKLLVPQHPGDILHRSATADKVGGKGVTQVVRGKASAKAVFATKPPPIHETNSAFVLPL